jgi:hypothetical protein
MLRIVLLMFSFFTFNPNQFACAADIAVGLASDYHAVRTTDTALTGLFLVSDDGLIQGYFVYENSEVNNTGTTYGFALNYKHLIAGTGENGFHVGAGIGVGSFPRDKSFMHINGLVGFRYSPASQVYLHVDGGISVGSADSKTEVMIGGNSALFGITLAYLL